MPSSITINGRLICPGHPMYIIAEMSANHGQSKEHAKEIIHEMKKAGADAVKIQTYTPDTITLNCDNTYFTDCLKGTLWEGRRLYDLYGDAFTPWEWQGELKELAESLGMDFFSSAFDETSVDFLESINVPAYKIASFELVHLPLIKKAAATGKPLIMSTGMATKEEIEDALKAARDAGAKEIALLKCTSAYPAKIEDTNLKTIPVMELDFQVPVGLSDHTPGSAVPVAAVSLGACIIEKHFVMSRERDKGPDSSFSMEPHEFRAMVDMVRAVERDPPSAHIDPQAMGVVHYGPSSGDKKSLVFRPSIFVVEDITAGEVFTEKNVRIIRPGYGLPPKELPNVLWRKAKQAIERGIPLLANLIQ